MADWRRAIFNTEPTAEIVNKKKFVYEFLAFQFDYTTI